jgi:predicted secreted protein
MYLIGGTALRYQQVVTYVTGLDDGTNGRLLDGFREFLVLRAGKGTNLVWWALVPTVVFGRDDVVVADENEQTVTEGLWDLLDEFLAEVVASGHHRIHHEYFL